MRSHGDPNQTDPTVDNHYGINITIPLSAPATLSNEVHGGTAPCNQYLAAASNALKAEHPAPPAPSNDATGVKYAACMRANGVPSYPDPTGNRTNLRGIDMNSPLFISANKLCGKQIGAPAWWINGWGPPETSRSQTSPQAASRRAVLPGATPEPPPRRPQSPAAEVELGVLMRPMTTVVAIAGLASLVLLASACGGAASPQWRRSARRQRVGPVSGRTAGGGRQPSPAAAHLGGGTPSGTPQVEKHSRSCAAVSGQMTKFATCVRSHGEPNFPDPNPQGGSRCPRSRPAASILARRSSGRPCRLARKICRRTGRLL